MNNIIELPALVSELIDLVDVVDGVGMEFNTRAVEIIEELADFSITKGIHQNALANIQGLGSLAAVASPQLLYTAMLERAVGENAKGNTAGRDATILIYAPAIHQSLTRERSGSPPPSRE